MKTSFKLSIVLSVFTLLFSNIGLAQDENSSWAPAADRGAQPMTIDASIVDEIVTPELTRNNAKPTRSERKKSRIERRERTKNALNILKENKKKNSGSGWASAGILLVILAIFLPWLSVGIYTSWDAGLTLLTLLLWLLGWLPGVIFGMLVLFDVVG